MWALIMTIYVTGSSQQGLSMSTLDNFQTEQACRYAGAQQEVALRNDLKLKTDGRYTFICVKKGEQMRDIVLTYTVKATFAGEEQEVVVIINAVKDLEEKDKTINDLIIEACEDADREYCTCSFNERQNYCDCACGEWNYEYEIIKRE